MENLGGHLGGLCETVIFGLLFLDPEDVRRLSLSGGESGTSVRDQGSYELVSEYGGTKSLSKGLGALGLNGLKLNYYSNLIYTCH